MNVGFDGRIKLEFHGAKVTSDGGLLSYRDLDDALGLFDFVSANFYDNSTERNIQHATPILLRQSIYSRLGCQTQRIYYVSNGKGGDRQEVVCRDTISD